MNHFLFLFSAIPSNEDDSDAGMGLRMETNDERRTSTILDNRQHLSQCDRWMNKKQTHCTYRSILTYLFKIRFFKKKLISSAFPHY
jgi:hypothetical protein